MPKRLGHDDYAHVVSAQFSAATSQPCNLVGGYTGDLVSHSDSDFSRRERRTCLATDHDYIEVDRFPG
jgi:hypothetical protein